MLNIQQLGKTRCQHAMYLGMIGSEIIFILNSLPRILVINIDFFSSLSSITAVQLVTTQNTSGFRLLENCFLKICYITLIFST